ncbi:MAG TPA: Ger(x)C family spore germination protein [Paenibacillus sp.]|jgi:spore germination protein KC
MKGGKRRYKLMLLGCSLISLGLLCGCWDRIEINDVAFVIGSSFDKNKDQMISTSQIALPSQLGGVGSEAGGGGTSGNENYLLISKQAKTMYLANKKTQLSLSRVLIFSHRRIMIFGEEFARAGIGSAIDILGRFPENRMSAYIVLTQGKGYDILSADAPIEQFPAEMVREIAKSTMKHPMNVKRMVNKLLIEGVDLMLPVVNISDSSKEIPDKSKSLIQMDGLGVFRGDRLVGFLNENEAQYAMMGLGEAVDPRIVLSHGGKDELITITLDEIKVKWKPSMHDSKFAITAQLEAEGSILENTSNENIEDQDLSGLEEQCNKLINMNLGQVVDKLQHEYRSDILGFGHQFKNRYPQEWDKVKDRWSEVLPTIKVSVNSTIHLNGTNQLMNSLGVKKGAPEQ